jgi:hypothetical protein
MTRNLIICTIGDKSCHPTWIAGPETSDFDLFLIYYGDGPDAAIADAQHYLRRKGFKFELLHHVAQEHRGMLAKYDHIWCPDDDIACSTRDLNLLFDIFQRYRLRLAQPAVAKGDVSYRSLIRKPGNILRYTPFVEVMCPVFTRDTFLELSGTFLESRSAWGLDWVWAKLLTPQEMAIIDKVGVHHTRALCSGEHYKFLLGLGIDPKQDFQRTLARHGGIDHVLFNRIRHGRAPMKRVVDRHDRRSAWRRLADHVQWRTRKRRAA